MDHFTVVCLVAWPLNESEAGVGLVSIETLLLFLRKFLLISMRTALLLVRQEKQGVSMKTRSTPASLSFKGQAKKLISLSGSNKYVWQNLSQGNWHVKITCQQNELLVPYQFTMVNISE